MLFSYYHCFGVQSEKPELCILAEKVDSLCVPVRVASLIETTAGVCRVGPEEAIVAELDDDGGIIISAVKPGRICLTPDLHDCPAITVKSLKILKDEKEGFKSFYVQERHEKGDWQPWNPLEKRVS